MQAQVWVFKMYDMNVMVRVARGSYSDYIKPLEMDADSIMAPHIMSVEDARKVVQMTRFNPIGHCRLLEYKRIKPFTDYCEHCDVLYRRALEPLGFARMLDHSKRDKTRYRLSVK